MSINLRPVNLLDNNNRPIYDSVDSLAFQGQYDANNNLLYKGMARPGTSTSATGWQIALLTYDANNNLLSITWPINASGAPSNDFTFVWSSRASYTYA